MQRYDSSLRDKPFEDYNEYMQYVFNCVNTALDKYIDVMKKTFASDQGGYKSILYPDIEIAGDTCRTMVERFYSDGNPDEDVEDEDEDVFDTDEDEGEDESDNEEIDEDLLALLGAFSGEKKEEEASTEGTTSNTKEPE